MREPADGLKFLCAVMTAAQEPSQGGKTYLIILELTPKKDLIFAQFRAALRDLHSTAT